MPTYEYKCANDHRFEQFQRMNDAPIDICPTCGAAAEKLMSGGAGLIFKGSGFYITDYGKDGKKAQLTGQQAGGKPETTGDGGSAPKSEVSGSGSDAAGAKKSDISSPATAKPDAGSPPKKTSGE